jgi:DNA-binding CsgD family transcriptional regulator
LSIHDVRNAAFAAGKRISTLAATGDVVPALRQAASAFGAQQGHISLRRAGVYSDPKAMRFVTYEGDLNSAYLATKAYCADPALAHLKSSTLAVSYDELDWSSTAAAEARALKRKFGVGPSGLAVSVFGPCGSWAIMVLSSTSEHAPWQEFSCEAKCMVTSLAIGFFERLKLIERRGERSGGLSPREKDVLCWTARGKTIAETAMILDIAPSTVRHALDSTRQKLDAATKSEAVAKAVTRGLLDLGSPAAPV